ncbi:MAG TPA: energy transducer TonB [Pseudomonadales bacterium]|nr:energy transducer TonB [Pseudomonadales bacterium]
MSRGRRAIAILVGLFACQASFAQSNDAAADLYKRAYDYCFDASQLLYKKDTAGAVQAFQQYQSLANSAFKSDPGLINNTALATDQKQAFCGRVEARLRSAQAMPLLQLANDACGEVRASIDGKDYAAAKSEWQRFISARDRALLIAPDVLSANVVLGSKIKQCDKLQARLNPALEQLPQSSLAAAHNSPVIDPPAPTAKSVDSSEEIKRCNAVLNKAKSASNSAADSLRAQWKKMQREFTQPFNNEVASCIDRSDEAISKLEQGLELQQHVDSFRREFDRALGEIQSAREACVATQDEIKPVNNTVESLRQVATKVKALQQQVNAVRIQSQATDAGQRASMDVIAMEKTAFDTCVRSIAAKIAANEQRNAFVAELTAPRVIKKVDPVMPNIAKKKDISGWVTLEYKVGIDGRTSNIKVVSASPKGVFEAAAVDAIRQWQFEPAKQNGRAIEADASEVLKFED